MRDTWFHAARLLSLVALAALPGLAAADATVEVLGSEREAAIFAEAYDGFDPNNILHDSCEDEASWSGVDTLIDELIGCSVEPGYGYASAGTRIHESSVGETGAVTNVRCGSYFFDDNYLMTSGYAWATYQQEFRFRVATEFVGRFQGTLTRTHSSVSETSLLGPSGVVASFAGPPGDHETSITFDESHALPPGDYLLRFNLRATQGFYYDGGLAQADVALTLSESIGVEPTRWGKIKSLYR